MSGGIQSLQVLLWSSRLRTWKIQSITGILNDKRLWASRSPFCLVRSCGVVMDAEPQTSPAGFSVFVFLRFPRKTVNFPCELYVDETFSCNNDRSRLLPISSLVEQSDTCLV